MLLASSNCSPVLEVEAVRPRSNTVWDKSLNGK